MKVAIMQPYFFPYLGYFQLLNAVDAFIFYDDVQFIKGGWINRNRYLQNGKPAYFGLQMIGASANKNINEIGLNTSEIVQSKLLKTLQQNYAKAPYVNDVLALVNGVLGSGTDNLAEMTARSVMMVCEYLGFNKDFYFSSNLTFGKTASDRTQRLIALIKGLNGKTYLNTPGGKTLYNKADFRKEGIELYFIEGELPAYTQQSKAFVPGLSIIDVLMYNSKPEVRNMLNAYSLA
jgi:hypothetical protein